jgi:CheY-like chemotaxis protein
MSLEETLQKKGWATRVAATPSAAMTEFRGFEPDVILMDINLETEYDGIGVAQSIRDLSDTPIVFLTGHSDPETFEKAKQTIPYGFISKPVQNHQLCHTVELALTQVQDRRKSKPALLAFASALTKLQYAVFTVDLEGRLLSWNQVASDNVGEGTLVKGAPLSQALQASADDEKSFIEAIEKAAKSGDSTDLSNNFSSLKSAWEYAMVSPVDQAQGEGVMVLLRKRALAEQGQGSSAGSETFDRLTGLPPFNEAHLKAVAVSAACALFHAQNYRVIATRLGPHVADEVMVAFTMNISDLFNDLGKMVECKVSLFRAAGPLIAVTLEADEFGLSHLRRAIGQFMSSRKNVVLELVSHPGSLVSISANHLMLPASLRDSWIHEANQLNERRTM